MIPNYVVIVAGGTGTRMQSDLPKQFIELCGKPILMHTIEAFIHYRANIRIMVVLPVTQIDHWQMLCKQYDFTVLHQVTSGGETRFHSVKNGLSQFSGNGLAAVHDGVRPLVSLNTITNCFSEAKKYNNAIPVMPLIDSVREISPDGTSRMVNRAKLRLVQTPQVFDLELLKVAYEQAYSPDFTDDASVFEQAGHTIHLVEGNYENIKITTPDDLIIAKTFINRY